MPKKKPPKPGEKPQKERFLKAARLTGSDDSGEKFERAMKAIAPPAKAKKH